LQVLVWAQTAAWKGQFCCEWIWGRFLCVSFFTSKFCSRTQIYEWNFTTMINRQISSPGVVDIIFAWILQCKLMNNEIGLIFLRTFCGPFRLQNNFLCYLEENFMENIFVQNIAKPSSFLSEMTTPPTPILEFGFTLLDPNDDSFRLNNSTILLYLLREQ
jgi:hypothetical protein